MSRCIQLGFEFGEAASEIIYGISKNYSGIDSESRSSCEKLEFSMERGRVDVAGDAVDSEADSEFHFEEAGHFEAPGHQLLALQHPFFVALALTVQLLKLILEALLLELFLVTPAVGSSAATTYLIHINIFAII